MQFSLYFCLLIVFCLFRSVSAIKNQSEEAVSIIENPYNKEQHEEPILANEKDVETLARLVLMRGHVVIDDKHKLTVDETRMDRLIDYLHVHQNDKVTSAGRIAYLYPATEERDLACNTWPMELKKTVELCKTVTSECLSSYEMMQLIPKASTFHQALARLCPLILFRQTRPLCRSPSIKHQENEIKLKLVEPSSERVWGFGVLFTTLSIVVSMGGLIVLPFLKRDARRTILTLFEGLAVGGLVGSAIIHLFPQAFDIVDEKFRKYFWKVFLIFLGIYIFYCFERILKLLTAVRSKGKRERVPSLNFEEINLQSPLVNYSPQTPDLLDSEKEASLTNSLDKKAINETRNRSSSLPTEREALVNSTRVQLAQCLATVNVNVPLSTPVANEPQTSSDARSHSFPAKQAYVKDVAARRQDQDTSSNTMHIDTVAWMIVLGDALLNFIDGLSIGAAFDRNILAGISIAVAVMLEEISHRLGTFAVLIRAGMSMKQSFLYIFLSACACYPGLVLGIILGDAAEEESPYIFALAGGMFLYMALVDVMKEMNRSMENALRKSPKSAIQILTLQNIGIIISIIFLAMLALYEQEMDFEAVEIQEITDNAVE